MAKEKLTYDLDLNKLGFKTGMADAINQTKTLDKEMDKVNSKAKQSGTSFRGLATALYTGLSIRAVTRFGAAVVESLKKQEYFSASLKTMLHGNTMEAKALEAQLISLAKTTPFSLEEVQGGTKQLLAYGFEAGKITENIKLLGDVSAGVGQPLGEIVYLYGTLRTQGRAFAKDIYQFTGRGIPIVKELAKQFKTTEKEVANLVSEGKVGFKEIEKAFKSMTKEGGIFFNLMADQSKTVGGRISNLGDTWEQLKVNIGKSQRGIIASTLSWSEQMLDIINNHFVNANFRNEATKGLGKGWEFTGWNDDKRDELPRASRFGEVRTFNSEKERQDFLYGNGGANKNDGWNEIGGLGSEARFKQFSGKYLKRFNDVAGMPEDQQAAGRGSLLADLRKERETMTELLKAGKISSKLAANQGAVIDELFNRVKGLMDLSKSAMRQDAADKAAANSDDALGKGLETNMTRPQNLIINITKLVEELIISTTNITETKEKIKEVVSEALIEAVNDVNYMDRMNGK